MGWRALARVEERCARWSRAEEAWQKLVDTAPKDNPSVVTEAKQARDALKARAHADRVRGRALAALDAEAAPEEQAEALAALVPLLDDPSVVDVLPHGASLAGTLARRSGDRAQARALLERAAAADRSDVDALKELASVCMEDGDLPRALSASIDAYRERPSDAGLVCNVGVCHLGLGDVEKAEEYIDLAWRLEPKDPIVLRAKDVLAKRRETNNSRPAVRVRHDTVAAMPRPIAVTASITLLSLSLSLSISLSVGCDSAIVANGVGEPVLATIGVDGGAVELQNGDVSFTLSVPALSLADDTELTLQQVDIEGVDGEAAVRFSPDGLTFARAAVLTFEPAPIGDVVVGLAFSEGDTDAELVFTSPTDDGVSMPIEHFSDAAAVDAEAARQLLGEEDGDAATSVDVQESIALGLGETLRRVVEPAAAVSAATTAQWRFAVAQLEGWHAEVVRADVGDLPGSIRNPETLDAAFVRVTEVVDSAGLGLLSQLQEPRCQEPGDEIGSLEDWIRVPFSLVADLNLRGVNAAFDAPCVAVELTVDGDETLQASDTQVVLDLNLQLVFDENRREPMDLTVYSFAVTGATGPEEFTSRDGRAPDLVFTRPPAGPTRPRAVTIIVDVATGDTQLGTLLQPPPFVFVAQEAMTATATATPSTISQPGGTSQVCVTVDASGQPVERFSMRVTTAGPGSVPSGQLITTTSELCTTFTAPTALPDSNATATVNASVTVDGAVLPASVNIGVEAGAVGSTLSGTISVEGTETSTGEQDNFSGFLRVHIAPDDTVTVLDGTGSALNNRVLCDRFGVLFAEGPGLARYNDPFPATDFISANAEFVFKDLGQDCLVVAEISTITLESGEVSNGGGDGTGRLSAITFSGTRTANGVTITATGTLLPE